MTKNNSDTSSNLLQSLDHGQLSDGELKVGSIRFTAAEKRELLKTITSPGWKVIREIYQKQRLIQIAVANLNVSQSEPELFYQKGKAAELGEMIKLIEKEANSLREEENAKNKPS